jgi:diguanylate cyclase (GGDEF)-like protein
MVDVDNFKTINDTYGHLEGDRTLVKVAHAIAQCAREADIIARLGGEEFIIALQHTDCEKSQIVANRILKTISELECGEKEKYSITASIGLSCFNASSQVIKKSSEQWIQEADKALYQAKHSGKNCTAIYTATEH